MAQKVLGVAMFEPKTQATDVVKHLYLVVFLKFFSINKSLQEKSMLFLYLNFNISAVDVCPHPLACLLIC